MSLRVISTPLRGKQLTQAAIRGSAPSSWYVSKPRGASQWKARAEKISRALVSHDWLTPLRDAIQPTGPAAERLERAAREGVVVTSGQQAALFGGPLYTWWKAFALAAFANALEDAIQMPVAPVYWAATDDSDYVEAASTVVTTSEGARRISLEHREDNGLPMARVPLGDIRSQIAELRSACGSASNLNILDRVEAAYGPSETIGSSFIKLLRDVLEAWGVSVIDASHPAVRQQGEPVMRSALARAGQVEAALLGRDEELKSAGYKSQVQTVRGRTLVFSQAEGRRARISVNRAAQLASDADHHDLSPNVLLRPILERSILPTVAYLGGPAEIAYFAQTTAVADALEVEPPLILARWSGMVLEPSVQKTLEKYNLAAEDFADPHAVETRLARESLPENLREEMEKLRGSVDWHIGEFAKADTEKLVPQTVIDGLRRNVAHRINRVERRYVASVKRRGNIALRDAAAARASLYPFNIPQERALNIVPFIARYGDELFNAVSEEARKYAMTLV